MKLLVVGLGSIGQRHVRCLRGLRGLDIEIIAYRQRGLDLEVTKDLTTRENVSLEELYGLRSFYDLEAALEERPTAALVCNPNHLHLPIAIELAKAGVHLFLEKPVSHSMETVEELEKLVEQRNLVCCVGYHLRFHPGIQRLVAMVRGGELGQIVSSHFDSGEYMPYWHRYEDYAQTFMAHEAEGGGVTLTQIHDIDVIYAMFGMPASVVSVGGGTGTLAMDAEDHVSSLLAYRTNSHVHAATLNHDCLRYPPRRVYRVSGTAGTLRFDVPGNELVHTPFDGEPVTLYADAGLDRNALFSAQMEHFLACLRGDDAPRVGLRDGVCSLEIALAIKESLRWERKVDLKTPKSWP